MTTQSPTRFLPPRNPCAATTRRTSNSPCGGTCEVERETMSTTHIPKVVSADYDVGDVDIERSIVTQAGFELRAAQAKSEDDVIAIASDADAVLTPYAG